MEASLTPQRPGNGLCCPACRSRQCIRVDRQGWTDRLYRWVGRFPWHCRQCSTRFYLNTRSTV
jgi:hypothetical protein